MNRKRTKTWSDLLGQILKLEIGTKAGKINIATSILLIILVGIAAIPSVVETIANWHLTFANKNTLSWISPLTANVLVLGTFLAIIFCMAFLMYATTKEEP